MPLQLWITFGISQYWDSPHRAALRPWIRTIALAWFASPQHDRWIVDFQDKGARCHEWFSCRQCCNLMMHYGLVEQVQGSSEVASWMETQGGIRHVQPLSKSEQNSGVRHLGAGAPLRGGKLWVLLPQGNTWSSWLFRSMPSCVEAAARVAAALNHRGGSDGSSWLRSLAGNVPCLFISWLISHDCHDLVFLSICALFWCVTWMCYYVIYGLLATYDFHLCSREFRWFILPNNERNDHTRTLRWFSLCIICIYI
jgi:hypothetical protein